MKKKLLVLSAISMCGLAFTGNAIRLNAEEEEEPIVVVEEPIEDEEEFDFGAWIAEHFDAKTIITLLSDATFIGAILKLATDLVKERKLTLASKGKVTEAIESLKNVLGQEMCDLIKAKLDEALSKITSMTEKTQNTLQKFAEVLALSQEGTPEARVAILELLAKLNLVDEELIEDAKKAVNDEVVAIEEKKESVVEELNKIESENTKGLI